MYVLEPGGHVFLLRFLPDSRRLLAGRMTDESVTFAILSLPDGKAVDLPLPRLEQWPWFYSGCGPTVAVHPSGETGYIAWGGKLFSFGTVADRPVPPAVTAHQVVLSPDGTRLLTADLASQQKSVSAFQWTGKSFESLWTRPQGHRFTNVAAFLPDGDRFLTIDLESGVSLHDFADGEPKATARYPASHSYQPQLSADGRLLGIIGYASWYLYDTASLGKPRKITANKSSGDYVSFAFHPNGRTMAMIHGGPTLVKIHDLETLGKVRIYKWKLGPLGAVAYSPDGTLGAAGSKDGRIVVWDSEG